MNRNIVMMMLVLLTVALPVRSGTCATFNGECCTQCVSGYFVANCNCLEEGKYIQFVAKLPPLVFLIAFIFIPVGLAFFVYLFLTWREVNNLLNRAKTERLRPAFIYSNQHLDMSNLKRQTTEELEDDKEEDAPPTS